LNFLKKSFSKNTKISHFTKILPVGQPTRFMRTDGQTDVMKLIVAFWNLEKAPKNNCCHSPGCAAEGDGTLYCNWYLEIPTYFSRMLI